MNISISLLLGGIFIYLAIGAIIIYLIVLIIKALKKYIRSDGVRKEKRQSN